ncbi:MAG TPA: DUF2283 domain-containing protein [Abditibacterium sp.]|jgi:uncharacterized protein YuzE
MKITYDADVDILRIRLTDAAIEESDEEKPGLILDYDADGQVVGFEILNATERVSNPRSVELALAA